MKYTHHIRYWFQESTESGRFVLSGLVSLSNAERLVKSGCFEKAEIVEDSESAKRPILPVIKY